MLSAAAFSSCELDEKFYSSVTPDTFITSPENTYAILGRPFTHTKWYMAGERWWSQELTTDELVCPTRGTDFYNDGMYIRPHQHTWTVTDRMVEQCYKGTVEGVARCLEAYEDLAGVDYTGIGLTQKDKDDHLMQLNTLMGYYYMRGLDFYGGMPLYKSTNDGLLSRSTDKETYAYVEQLLKDAIPLLYTKEVLGKSEDGYIRRAAAAALLAQLYFNAEAYIGEAHFTECAKICQDIIDGVYGKYELDPTWYGPHSFDNDCSPEMIWSMPSENAKQEWTSVFRYNYHYNANAYFDTTFPWGPYNGYCLTPSRESATSGIYTQWKLGNTFEKFHDKDLRKQPYVYHGNKQYTGMFCMGPQQNPYTKQWTKGQRDKLNQNLIFVDYINNGKGSGILNGTEESGFRLVKSPIPNTADLTLLWNPDCPMIRLTEIYYMLAECKWRTGDKPGAAKLINTVRKRNFEGGIDPDPVPDNFDVYRLADEWMIEFLGEMRRRTDLIRLGLFTTEDWWEHTASDPTKNRFPIPAYAIQANPNLEQNPGY